jgi:hypothetical protein
MTDTPTNVPTFDRVPFLTAEEQTRATRFGMNTHLSEPVAGSILDRVKPDGTKQRLIRDAKGFYDVETHEYVWVEGDASLTLGGVYAMHPWPDDV